MTPKEIDRRYRELAKFSVEHGKIWRTRFRAIAITTSLTGSILGLICGALFGLYAVALLFIPLVAYWWFEGDKMFARGLKSRQEALDEAKQFADDIGEE